MKSFLSKHKWKLLLAFIIFIVAIPLGINSLFKLTSPLDIFVAEWEAGDALAFYGVMLASARTGTPPKTSTSRATIWKSLSCCRRAISAR